MPIQKIITWGLIGSISLTALLHIFAAESLPSVALLVVRWLTIAIIIIYSFRKKSLTTWIIASMAIGIEIGYTFPDVAKELNVIRDVFLKLIKSIIAPLLFGTLVVGIAGHSDLKQVGRMGWKSLLYFEIVTTLALLVGLAAINISQAGVGAKMLAESKVDLPPVKEQTATEIILHVFPENLAKSVAEGQVLQIVVFSVLFGIGLALVEEKKRSPMLHFSESLAETMFKFTNLIMYLAPFAVGAAIAFTVGKMGIEVLLSALKLLATLYVALIIFLAGVLLPIALLFKVPIRKFIKAIAEPVSIAFATTSSESALPKAMEAMEKLGVPRKVVSFVMPTGYSFNLDGTTLYLSLATVFVAQAAGRDLPLSEQALVVFMLMLTSKGVAGVPRASLVILLGAAHFLNLPEWPIFIIFGIDAIMDMARTSVNVIGNCLASVVVAKWEGEFVENKNYE